MEEEKTATVLAETSPRRKWLMLLAATLSYLVCFCIGFVIVDFVLSENGDHDDCDLLSDSTYTSCVTQDAVIVTGGHATEDRTTAKQLTTIQDVTTPEWKFRLDDKVGNCSDELLKSHAARSGVYTISVSGQYVSVFCDLETDGGGWTVFQRRGDGNVNFAQTWEDYATGFGNLSGEFWLGNRLLHSITSVGTYSLRIDLEDFDNEKRYAVYDQFAVDSEKNGFRLTVGGYSGNAGDSLASSHNGSLFSSHDRDYDESPSTNCAALFECGWWYWNCFSSNLNGKYLSGKHKKEWHGIIWTSWKNSLYSLKRTEMKIRPKH